MNSQRKLKLRQEKEVSNSKTSTQTITGKAESISQKYRWSGNVKVANNAIRFDHIPDKDMWNDYSLSKLGEDSQMEKIISDEILKRIQNGSYI